METSNSYPFDWALEVFEAFLKKFTRGAKLLEYLYEYDEWYPVALLQYDQERWELYKKAVKYCEKQINEHKNIFAEILSNDQFRDEFDKKLKSFLNIC